MTSTTLNEDVRFALIVFSYLSYFFYFNTYLISEFLMQREQFPNPVGGDKAVVADNFA